MKNTPIERHLIDETINEFQIVDFYKATIREVKAIACLLYTSLSTTHSGSYVNNMSIATFFIYITVTVIYCPN